MNPRVAADRIHPSGEPIDGGEDGSIEPGDVNAHTHVYSGLAPLGMPPPEPPPQSFVELLERVWWRLDRALTATELRAGARLYIAEALLAGTTTLIDHHESPNMIDGSLSILADAAEELGIRMVVCYGATERNGGREEARRGLAECRRFIERDARPTVRGIVGLHASFTVSDDAIREAGALCRDLGVPIHVHVAEDGADVTDARARGYEGPLERLFALGAIAPGSILAHGIHLTPTEMERAAEAGSWLVHNPRSNEGNRVGYARCLSAASRVALGTDGYPARMEDEERALERLSASHGDDLGRSPGRRAASRLLAAELFGVAMDLGASSAADLVVRRDGCVQDVMVGGRWVVRGGALLTADLDTIRAEAVEHATKLWPRMAALGPSQSAAGST